MFKALLSRLFTSRKKARTRKNKQRLYEAYATFRELERETLLIDDMLLRAATLGVTAGLKEELSSIPDLDILPDGWHKLLTKEKLLAKIRKYYQQMLLKEFKKRNAAIR